jgi:sugar lactone lactonase YvrE
MKLFTPVFLLIAAVAAVAVAEPAPLVPPDAELETVSTGDFKFTEGPALAPDGSIYFSDIPNNAIHRYDPATGETTLFTDESGGANGLMFASGGLWACAGEAREVRIYPALLRDGAALDALDPARDIYFRLDPVDDAAITRFEGKRLNKPNDLVAHPAKGGLLELSPAIYFTDPIYGRVDPIELPSEAVYALVPDPDQPEGTMQIYAIERIIDDLVRPNGISLSPGGETLYVNDNGDKKIWAYPILEPGKVGEGRVLNDLSDYKHGPDGMTVGPHGRIYTTIYGQGVLILSPGGQRLGFIETGPQTTNCTFGADGRTLYVTAEKSLKRITLNPGAPR